MEKLEVLKQCTINNLTVKLPDVQLDRKTYLEVAKALNLIGGKWKGGKTQGFVFQEDPTEMLAEIANGTKRNLQKEYQFFATPEPLADKIVGLACINELDRHSRILEPSAGQGAIVKSILKNSNIRQVDCCELMPLNQKFLRNIDGILLIGDDFLKLEGFENYYDRVIANPPFSKNQDIDHIRKMYECCKPGGVIVTICSNHWVNCSNKKEREFAKWLGSIRKITMQGVPEGSFKESGTNVTATILVIYKD